MTAAEPQRLPATASLIGAGVGCAARGCPRTVNNLAVQALLAACADGKAVVDESSARAAAAEVTATD
jgi:type II secretory pathway predicted ATPase ExeA